MARPRKRKDTEPSNSKLLEAVRFVSMACSDKGPINETHLYLGGQWAAACNGTLTIACKIKEEIFACPQSKLFVEALSKCEESYDLTNSATQISIKSGKFKASIPCISPDLLFIGSPDDACAIINDDFKSGLEIVGILTDENAQNIYSASILMNGQSLISTNAGKIIFEYWHGIDLPSGLAIPKSVIKPLVSAGKKLAKLGFSQSSLTFYFEDESWIKTQLFIEKWPDVISILDRQSNQLPLPKDFWEGLAAVAPFSEDGLVWFDAGTMRSHATEGVGAAYEVAGLPKGPSFSIKQLALLNGLASTVDFFTPGPFEGSTMLTFYGDRIRGAIAGRI